MQSLVLLRRDFFIFMDNTIRMEIQQYLDSTYLKTPEQAGLSPEDNHEIVRNLVGEAIRERFKLVMIRPDHVAFARKLIDDASSSVAVGTVIDFPKGNGKLQSKLREAEKAIADGADELDFVSDYEAFVIGDLDSFTEEIIQCTRLGLSHLKIVKWIIEVAALNNEQIAKICACIKHVIFDHIPQDQHESVFVKSSTGFFKTPEGKPNGATRDSIVIMLENASPLPVKAAGGVRSYEEAVEMINLGVKRIGTSSAKAIADGAGTVGNY